MVEELNNKDIDKTLEDSKLENNKMETTVIKPSKNKKKEARSKSEIKTAKSRTKNKKILEEPEELPSPEPVSLRKEEFVEYEESEYTLKEITGQDQEILIGPKRLTRFEKARITGARALQLSFWAPIIIKVEDAFNLSSSIALAIEEARPQSITHLY